MAAKILVGAVLAKPNTLAVKGPLFAFMGN